MREYILKDEERLKEFKLNAYKRSKDLDINKIVPLYEEIYQRALNKSSLDKILSR
jgi:hypothetical protein